MHQGDFTVAQAFQAKISTAGSHQAVAVPLRGCSQQQPINVISLAQRRARGDFQVCIGGQRALTQAGQRAFRVGNRHGECFFAKCNSPVSKFTRAPAGLTAEVIFKDNLTYPGFVLQGGARRDCWGGGGCLGGREPNRACAWFDGGGRGRRGQDDGRRWFDRTGGQPAADEYSANRQTGQPHQQSTTCSRSGPTETWQTATPLISEMRAR